jgi:hypothetical protein
MLLLHIPEIETSGQSTRCACQVQLDVVGRIFVVMTAQYTGGVFSEHTTLQD